MTKRSNFIKALLTTASALALISGNSAQSAMRATVRTTTGLLSTIGVNNGLQLFVDGDNISVHTDSVIIKASSDHLINNIDTGNFVNTQFTNNFVHNITLSSVTNSGGVTV